MMRRSRFTRGALAVLAVAWMLVSSASTMRVRAQASWPFQLEWTQATPASYYRLCVNSACSVLADARTSNGTVWRAALPVLSPGEYRLVVQACTGDQCVAGLPDLMIRVMEPSSRRPPIDVLDGPRIPVSR